jgi:hypothetical protein
MKKYLGIGLIAVLIVYAVGWYIAARIVEGKIITSLDNMKAQGTIKGYSTSVKVTGFPFRFDIAFEHPNIRTYTDQGQYNILYDGTLKIRPALLGSSITLITNGDLHVQGNIYDYKFHLVSSGEGRRYRVGLKYNLLSPGLIKTLNQSEDVNELLLALVKEVSVQGRDLSTVNKLTNNRIFTADEAHIDVMLDSNNGTLKARCKEKLENAQFSKESLLLWRALNRIPSVNKLMASLDPHISSYFEVFNLPTLGVINSSMNVSLDKKGNAYDILVDEIVHKDALEDIKIDGRIYVSSAKSKVNLSSSIECAPQYYDMLDVYLRKVDAYSGLASPFNQVDKQFGKVFGGIFGNEPVASRKDYSFSSDLKKLGKIESNVDATYAEAGTDYSVELHKFKLKAKPFSLKLNGDVKRKQGRTLYDAKIAAENYEYITDMALDYVEGTQMNKTAFKVLDVKMTNDVRSDVKRFVREVSDDPTSTSKDISLTLSNDGSSTYPAVGKYSSSEFAQKVNSLALNLAMREGGKKIERVRGTIKGLKDDPVNAAVGLLNDIFQK